MRTRNRLPADRYSDPNGRGANDRVLDEELPRYAEALERLGQ